MDEAATTTPAPRPVASGSGWYRWYVLGLLMIIYAFNFLDRQVVSILAPSLKAELHLTDAQLGLLFGTAFALFYGLFGIPLARLADGWNRVSTISLGLLFWSAMTSLSGMASNFTQLGLARIGVGIGEASASPAAFSIIQDYFPKEKRGTALSLYASGIYIGSGLALVIGGSIVAYWNAAFLPIERPFGLSGWQVTFLAFGIPGIALALLTWLTVREPVRGGLDGIVQPGDPAPFRSLAREFGAIMPPWSILNLIRHGDGAAVRRNLGLLTLVILGAYILYLVSNFWLPLAKRATIASLFGHPITTNAVQWTALAIGVYGSGSWLQSLRIKDTPTHHLVICRSFVLLTLAGALISFVSYSISAFLFTYVQLTFAKGPETGVLIGTIITITGGVGTIGGGMIGDRLRRIHPAARIYGVMVTSTIAAITGLIEFSTDSYALFLMMAGLTNMIMIMWLGPIAATCQDLVLPRMRGTATAALFLCTNLIGLGLGPYTVGLISDVTGSLSLALRSGFMLFPLVLALLWYASRSLPEQERTMLARARSAGEPV